MSHDRTTLVLDDPEGQEEEEEASGGLSQKGGKSLPSFIAKLYSLVPLLFPPPPPSFPKKANVHLYNENNE